MHTIAILQGDGIGKEVVREAKKIITLLIDRYDLSIKLNEAAVGGAAYDEYGTPLPDETLRLAKGSDAVLLGAVGGTKWEGLDYSVRPERALLGLRAELGLFANLRPAKVHSVLIDASTLKPEIINGIDILVVRELTGGIYFGSPRGIERLSDETYRGINTLVYTTYEIQRIAKLAFELSLKRRKKVTSVDKANVLESTELWRNVVSETHRDFQEVELNHMYVDNCAMQLIRYPEQFDVIVTANMFGDILSDEAAMLTGSIGMLPSASIGGRNAMYEPVHGSAPDIEGKDIANPIAAIMSAAMMFKYSFNQSEISNKIEAAVSRVLEKGYRTKDIEGKDTKVVGTNEMGDLIAGEIMINC